MVSALCAAAMLAACAGPRTPDWQSDAHASLERFKRHYLEGDSRRAERDFTHARTRIAATGRLDLAARAELLRCAVAVASLDFQACDGFERLRADAADEDRAYAAFLSGDWQDLDVRELPAQYRPIAGARTADARTDALRRIEDPLSRLIAAGALFRTAGLPPSGVEAAVDTASTQGYRRPLLAFLNVQAALAEDAADAAAVETIRRRIELILN
ncbi:MAG TPA: hypothetical protein VMP00_08045 [Burkholderiales bacterium]|nr:hypothetical protein [Burkholderiales bacterium]